MSPVPGQALRQQQRNPGTCLLALLISASGLAPAARAAAPVNPVVVFANQARVSACAGMALVVGEKLVGASASSGVSMANAPANGAAMFSPSLDSRDATGPHFVSAFLAPNNRGGCDAGYDDVRYWPKSCTDLGAQELSGLGVPKPLGAAVSTFVMGPNQHVYLMPAGPGCVTIRKELLF